jgi:hypothetical protein
VRIDELITKEADMYLQLCRNAAQHDDQEFLWRMLAHAVFYHLQELRTTSRDRTTSPISIR